MEFKREEISTWSLSDCVDFLREKDCKDYPYLLHNKNPLIVLRKAVEEVMEEKE